MSKTLSFKLVALFIGLLCILSVQVVTVATLEQMHDRNVVGKNNEKDEMISSYGIKYVIEVDYMNQTLAVRASNQIGHQVDYSGFVVTVDGYELFEVTKNFSDGEQQNWVINYSNGINTLKSNHTIIVSTYGNSTGFRFDKGFSPDSGSIPTPYIQNVEITNGTIDGEPSAVAKVTVANPSIHPYSLKLMVHTLDTDGSFYGASVSPGENRTITVELLDEQGTQIAGQARLYAGNLSKGDGAMDQVGFAGRAGKNTKAWNETYEPVRGPWRSDGYEYHNETYGDDASLAERLSGGYEILGVPVVYAVLGLVVGLVLVRRIR